MLVGFHLMNLILLLSRLARLRLECERVGNVCEKKGEDKWRFN